MEEKRMRRSRERIAAGVCGGIAEYFNTDPTLVRLILLLIALFTGIFPGIIAYLVLWLVMPPPLETDGG